MAKHLLQEDGWITDSKPHTKFHSPDVFGYFDIIALKGDKTRYIQVKSNISDFYTARKAIRQWMEFMAVTAVCEVWLYKGRGEWRREVIKIETL